MWNREQRRGLVAIGLFLGLLLAGLISLFVMADPLHEEPATEQGTFLTVSLVELEGQVVDAITGRPLVDPEIQVLDPAGRCDPWIDPPDPARPGRFRIGGIPLAEGLRLRVQAPDYQPVDRALSLLRAEDAALGRIALRPLRRVGGTVLDPEGTRREGATVQLLGLDGEIRHTLRTDERGSFDSDRRVVADHYLVRAFDEEGTAASDGPVHLDLTRIGDAREIQLELALLVPGEASFPGAGAVWLDGRRFEVAESGRCTARGLAGWDRPVELELAEGGREALRLDWPPSEASEASPRPAPAPKTGTWSGMVLDLEGRPLRSARAHDSTRPEEQWLADMTGRLVIDLTASGDLIVSHRDHARQRVDPTASEVRLAPGSLVVVEVQDPDGVPVAGAALQLGGQRARTDATGQARFPSWPSGLLPPLRYHDGGRWLTPPPQTTIEEAQSRIRWTLTAYRPTDRELRLTEGGADLAEGRALDVRFPAPFDRLPARGAQAAAQGRVRLKSVPPGDWILEWTDPGGRARRQRVDPTQSGAIELEQDPPEGSAGGDG